VSDSKGRRKDCLHSNNAVRPLITATDFTADEFAWPLVAFTADELRIATNLITVNITAAAVALTPSPLRKFTQDKQAICRSEEKSLQQKPVLAIIGNGGPGLRLLFGKFNDTRGL
jgi:hypothetical protein